MVRLIAHRGNQNGREIGLENHPNYIDKALENGFDAEVDLWISGDEIFLGHDQPQVQIEFGWLAERSDYLWVHAKTLSSAVWLSETKLNWFLHDQDQAALTSRGFIWLFPEQIAPSRKSVRLIFEAPSPERDLEVLDDYYAVCSDHVSLFRGP